LLAFFFYIIENTHLYPFFYHSIKNNINSILVLFSLPPFFNSRAHSHACHIIPILLLLLSLFLSFFRFVVQVAFMGMLYLVYLVECYHSPIRIDLLHAESQDSVLSKLAQLKMAQPRIWWKAISYHYVRRKRQITRYRNGDNYTTTQVIHRRIFIRHKFFLNISANQARIFK